MKPHQHSDKTPEELAAQREHRLRARNALAYIQSGAVGKALDVALDILEDPQVARRTKARLIQSLLANANRAAQGSPQVQIDARTTHVTAADLLRMVESGGFATPTGCMSGTTTPVDGLPAPSADLTDAHRLAEPVADADEGAVEESQSPGQRRSPEAPPAARTDEDGPTARR